MPEQGQFAGLLAEYGLETEEQARARKSTTLFARGVQSAQQHRTSRERMGHTIGAGIGALALSFFNKGLNPEEAKEAAALKDANTKYSNIRATPEFNALPPEQQALAYQEQLSKSLADVGMFDAAARMSQQAMEKKIGLVRQGLELKKLEGGIERDTESLGILKEDRIRSLAGEYRRFVIPSPDGGFAIDDLENNTAPGRVNENGELEVRNANGTIEKYNSFLTFEEGLKLQQEENKLLAKAGGATQKDREASFNRFYSSKERQEIRAKKDAVGQQMDIMNGIFTQMEQFMAAGRDPAMFVGDQGRITNFTTNLSSTISALGETYARPITDAVATVGPQGKTLARGPKDVLNNEAYRDEIAGIALPAGIDPVGQAANEYRASIVELAYAVARANEPGARQLSDNDFRQALQQIGADASDPEKLRNTIMKNLGRKLKSFDGQVKLLKGVAQRTLGDGERGLGIVFGGTLGDFSTEREEISQRGESLGLDIQLFSEGQALRRAGIQPPAAPAQPPAASGVIKTPGGATIEFLD